MGDRWWPLLAVLAFLVALGLAVATAEGDADDDGQPGLVSASCFPWGGQGRCWGPGDGQEFAGWLNAHGSSPERFQDNFPELAAVFREPWPPRPYWKTCASGRACAEAVIPHWFEDAAYALSIVACETGGSYDARTVGDAGERGWFQIHPVHRWAFAGGDLFDPRYNTAVAWRLSQHGRDFSPWTCA